MKSNNPLERFNIKWLSASSINQYINNTPLWVLSYPYGFTDKFGNPAFWRGIAAEHGICLALKDQRIGTEKAIIEAQKEFKRLKNDFLKHTNVSPQMMGRIKKEEKDLSRYVSVGVPYFKQFGKPTSFQKKIRLEIDGCPVPLIGYTDLQYDGMVRDIKTANRTPAAITDSYGRQLAIYATAEDSSAIVDYVYVTSTQAKVMSKPVEDLEKYMDQVRTAIFNMMNLLSKVEDVNELASLFFPNFDDWMWSDNQKQEAKKLWNIK